MKKSIVILAGLALITSCGESDKSSTKGEVVSAIEAGGENEDAYLEEHKEEINAELKELEEEQKLLTTFKFDKEEHFFGKIKLESENDCEFKVTNTGKQPLIIENVQASCGCTTPQKPDKPIPPGKSDVIKVHFKPSSSGKGIEKTVTVTANTDPRISVVKIKADVE
jgi:Protein of unknown function (DUF1573)